MANRSMYFKQSNCPDFIMMQTWEYQVMFLGEYVKRTYCIYDYDGQFYIKKDTKKIMLKLSLIHSKRLSTLLLITSTDTKSGDTSDNIYR